MNHFIRCICITAIAFCSFCIAAECDFNWSAMGSPNGAVYAIAKSGDDLYVGGDFTSIGGIQAYRIAKWDGENWHPLVYNGYNGIGGYGVRVITINGSDVYVGGSFTTAGGVTANSIAKWNGSSWSNLGDGITGPPGVVEAIAIGSDGIYVGGYFDEAGGVEANNVARWSNGSWHKLQANYNGQPLNGVPGPVYSLGVQYGTNVYIGGDFFLAGDEDDFPAGLMIWYSSSSSWNQFVLGPYGTVYSIINDSDYMYLGGSFSGGIKATYNGSSYSSPPGGGVNNAVHAIYIDNVMDHIYAGGKFTTAGGNSANRIARWDGDSWSGLCSGVNNTVHAIVSISGSTPAIHWGNVFVGGVFTTAGGKSISNLAQWANQSISQKASIAFKENIASEFKLHANFPNPFNPTTSIQFDLPEEGKVRLSVYDIGGQFITNIVNNVMPAGQHVVGFDASNLASGLYLYRLEAMGIIETRKMLLLK